MGITPVSGVIHGFGGNGENMKSALNRLFIALLIVFAAVGGQSLVSSSIMSSASADELLPGLTPSLRMAVVSAPDGFNVYVDNYDPAYTWSAAVSQGILASRVYTNPASMIFSVRGIALADSATLTVTASRIGYSDLSLIHI